MTIRFTLAMLDLPAFPQKQQAHDRLGERTDQ